MSSEYVGGNNWKKNLYLIIISEASFALIFNYSGSLENTILALSLSYFRCLALFLCRKDFAFCGY